MVAGTLSSNVTCTAPLFGLTGSVASVTSAHCAYKVLSSSSKSATSAYVIVVSAAIYVPPPLFLVFQPINLYPVFVGTGVGSTYISLAAFVTSSIDAGVSAPFTLYFTVTFSVQ